MPRSSSRGAGFFAVGVWHPKTGVNVGGLWRSASLYGAAFVFTVGARYRRQASDTAGTPWRTPLLHFADVEDLRAHLPWSCPLVGVELAAGAVPLAGYAHRDRAVYLLGAEDHGLPDRVLAGCHELVVVEAPGIGSLNVAVAGSIVLRDRFVKRSEPVARDRSSVVDHAVGGGW